MRGSGRASRTRPSGSVRGSGRRRGRGRRGRGRGRGGRRGRGRRGRCRGRRGRRGRGRRGRCRGRDGGSGRGGRRGRCGGRDGGSGRGGRRGRRWSRTLLARAALRTALGESLAGDLLNGGPPDDKLVDGDCRVVRRTLHDDAQRVLSELGECRLEQDLGRRVVGRVGVHGLDQLAVNVDLGLAAGRTDRPDPGDAGAVEGDPRRRAGLRRRASQPARICRMPHGRPGTLVVDACPVLLVCRVAVVGHPRLELGRHLAGARDPEDRDDESHESETHDSGRGPIAETATAG